MATNSSAQYWLRAGGSDLNGAGYDSGISGAGTNYCDQDAAQASFSNLALSSGSITDSASGGLFTAAMVGNLIRVAAQGYYWITARTNGNVITVTAATGTSATSFSGASGKVGGALATPGPLSSGGSAGAPSIAGPFAPGNQVNVRGAGSDDPGTADYSLANYYSFPDGDQTATGGSIRWVGYNGRPRIDCGAGPLFGYLIKGHVFQHFKFVAGGAGLASFGFLVGVSVTAPSVALDCIFDQAGNDVIGVQLQSVADCEFRNSGSTSAGTLPAILDAMNGSEFVGCTINGWRGGGVKLQGNASALRASMILNTKADGILVANSGTSQNVIAGCTIDNNAGHGINVSDAVSVAVTRIRNNLVTNHSGGGKVGITTAVTSAQYARVVGIAWDYNDVWNNTANYSGCSAGAHDLTVDPAYAGAAGINVTTGNYAVGTAVKATGSPGAFRGTATTSYVDMGAVQRQEAGGGGATYSRGRIVNG